MMALLYLALQHLDCFVGLRASSRGPRNPWDHHDLHIIKRNKYIKDLIYKVYAFIFSQSLL